MPSEARSRALRVVGAVVALVIVVLVYTQVRGILAESRLITVASTMYDLRAAELRFYDLEGTYASDPSELDFQANEHVELRIEAGPEGWSAVGWWRGRPDRGCASSFGRVARVATTPGGLTPSDAEPVVCDRETPGGP